MQPILKIDLTTGGIDRFNVPQDWFRDYLGGASLAARLLYDRLLPDLDPLSPEAELLFLNGPLSGTAGPTVGRFVICAKSPATGLWGESNCGGFWGPELRKAGFDGIWITGKAEEPRYVWIRDGSVEIRPASHLWGIDAYKIQDAIQVELNVKSARIAGIGEAGEKQLPFALVLCDHGRVAGRTGMGAVMGSKNLKAIAARGTGNIPLSDPNLYSQLRSDANKDLRNDTVAMVARDLGTGSVADFFDYLGSMPKRGYQRGQMDGAEQISGSALAEKYLVGVSACHGCVVACGRVVKIDEKRGKQKGPEYETLVGFGPNLWLNDIGFATRMGELCDLYGMDTISLSNTISLAFTLFERGVISTRDTGGLVLEWGDRAVVETLVHQTVRGEGLGALIGKGARAFAREFDMEELAVQVNGLEAAYHDPRGVTGMALVYATSPRGACHNQSDYFLCDIGQADEALGMSMHDRQGGAEKVGDVVIHQNWRTIFNSLVMCLFGNIPPQTLVDLVNAGCGFDYDLTEILTMGERGWNLKRAINNRLGLTRENDKLPKRFLEPLPDGGSAGFIIDFEPMLKAYYEARQWDWETGRPSFEKLQSLNLGFVADDLWCADRLFY